MANRLTVFVNAKLLPPTEKTSRKLTRRRRPRVEYRELNDTPNGTIEEFLAGPAQQDREEDQAASQCASEQYFQEESRGRPVRRKKVGVEHSERQDARNGTSQRPDASIAQQYYEEVVHVYETRHRTSRRTPRRHVSEQAAHEGPGRTAMVNGNDTVVGNGFTSHRHTNAADQRSGPNLVQSYHEEVPEERRASSRVAHRNGPEQATPGEPRRGATVNGNDNVLSNGFSLHSRADAVDRVIAVDHVQSNHEEVAAERRSAWRAERRHVPGPATHAEPRKVVMNNGNTNARSSGHSSRHHARQKRETPGYERPVPLNDPRPENLTTEDLHEEYWYAKDQLAKAQRRFDKRFANRARECAQNNRMLRNPGNVPGLPQEELDLRWMQRISQLTRELIESEDFYQKAKIAAVEGGCAVSDTELSSVFAHQGSEGYSPSFEDAMKAHAPKEMIESWCQAIPDFLNGPEIGAVSSDVDAGEQDDPDFRDSASAVAQDPRDQAKIQKWRKTCDKAGKRPAR